MLFPRTFIVDIKEAVGRVIVVRMVESFELRRDEWTLEP